MECNKDDAIKAKEMAEKKFEAKDIAGAKKFALKAQNLYPGLEGISQMLVTLNVYASAENTTFGEADWYGVLGVSPQADEDTVKRQYRKLALLLHPDKNKSIGAEGAFNLIAQAWSFLSDKCKRAAYDAAMNAKGSQQKAKLSSDGSSVPPGANGFYNFAKPTTSNAKANKTASHRNGSTTTGSTDEPTRRTFWTICHRCRMQYEYLRSYLNHNIVCPSCQKPFLAIETTLPVPNGSRSGKNSGHHRQKSPQQTKNKSNRNAGYNERDFQWVPFSGATGASSVAQAADVVHQTYEKVRKEREEAQAAKKRDKAMKKKIYLSEDIACSSIEKKRRLIDDFGVTNNQIGKGGAGHVITNSHSLRRCDFGSLHHANKISYLSCTKDQSHIESCNLLMRMAKQEISKRLNEWKSANVIDCAAQKKKVFHNQETRKTDAGTELDRRDAGSTSLQDVGARDGLNFLQGTKLSTAAMEMTDQVSIPVPDADFYNFDKGRTGRDFENNQVWAVYDNDDWMPRYYVMVRSVISRDPFKVKISWLSSKRNTEFGLLSWNGSGILKSCGEFRVGKRETYVGLNCCSHKVSWTKGTHGAIRILPRKGDVWALYRNWSPDWNELTSEDVIHEYDLVEVLENFDEKFGVIVIPLVKVTGFKAVFHHHLNPNQARWVPKEEIFRFSHQVPSHLLSGQEAPNAPKGCRELDPAAVPVEFLKVIANFTEDIGDSQATNQGKNLISDGIRSIDIEIPESNEEWRRQGTKDIKKPLEVEVANHQTSQVK